MTRRARAFAALKALDLGQRWLAFNWQAIVRQAAIGLSRWGTCHSRPTRRQARQSGVALGASLPRCPHVHLFGAGSVWDFFVTSTSEANWWGRWSSPDTSPHSAAGLTGSQPCPPITALCCASLTNAAKKSSSTAGASSWLRCPQFGSTARRGAAAPSRAATLVKEAGGLEMRTCTWTARRHMYHGRNAAAQHSPTAPADRSRRHHVVVLPCCHLQEAASSTASLSSTPVCLSVLHGTPQAAWGRRPHQEWHARICNRRKQLRPLQGVDAAARTRHLHRAGTLESTLQGRWSATLTSPPIQLAAVWAGLSPRHDPPHMQPRPSQPLTSTRPTSQPCARSGRRYRASRSGQMAAGSAHARRLATSPTSWRSSLQGWRAGAARGQCMREPASRLLGCKTGFAWKLVRRRRGG